MSRLLRTASELFILAIIASKKEVHPYEVYQKLISEIFYSKQIQIQSFSHILQVGKSYLKYLQEPSKLNENLLREEIKKILPKGFPLKDELNIDKKSKDDSIQILSHLIKEADINLNEEEGDLRIWDSKTAIYQVMKELEREDLITVARTEIYKGRGRKIYAITLKGKITAVHSLLLFGDLYQKVFPQITLFTDFQKSSSEDPGIRLLQILENVLSTEMIMAIFQNEEDSPLKQLIKELFPLVRSEVALQNLIILKDIPLNLFDVSILPLSYRSIYKKMIIQQLSDYKKHIENVITQLEEKS